MPKRVHGALLCQSAFNMGIEKDSRLCRIFTYERMLAKRKLVFLRSAYLSKISDSQITKGGANTESFYDFLISKYIAPQFTFLLSACGVKRPNNITLMSLVLLLAAAFMVLFTGMLNAVWYRAVIAVLIQFSFIFDCSDGQLARITGTTSKLGAWLDRLSDRLGEFIIFSFFGYSTWKITGQVVFLYLGVVTGYGLAIFTLAMSLAESIRFDNIEGMIRIRRSHAEIERIKHHEETDRSGGNHNPEEPDSEKAGGAAADGQRKKRKIVEVAPKIFFFLNFGIGERYLYLSFFIVLLRPDIMLYISSFLAVLRCLSISHFIGRKIKKTDREIADVDKANS